MPKTDQEIDDFIDILERHFVGVMDRNVSVTSTEIRRVSSTGTYGDRVVMAKPERNAAIGAHFKLVGISHGKTLSNLSGEDASALIGKLTDLRDLIYNSLGVAEADRARLTRRAQELVGQSRSAVTASQYRDVEKGLDEIIASSPAANYLTGALDGMKTRVERTRSREALEAIASVISAVRIPTEAAQARDSEGYGAFHPTKKDYARLRPVGGGGGHDRFNRERASVGMDVLRNLRADTGEELYRSIETLVRAASAATANSLSMSTKARNYYRHNGEDERLALQDRHHNALKAIVRLGRPDSETQELDTPNRSSATRRAVSPERRKRSRDRSRSRSPVQAASSSSSAERTRGRSAKRQRDAGRVENVAKTRKQGVVEDLSGAADRARQQQLELERREAERQRAERSLQERNRAEQQARARRRADENSQQHQRADQRRAMERNERRRMQDETSEMMEESAAEAGAEDLVLAFA